MESHRKANQETEGLDAAWGSERATIMDWVVSSTGGPQTPESIQLGKDDAAWPSKSLSQKKAIYATWKGVVEGGKNKLIANQLGAEKMRANINAINLEGVGVTEGSAAFKAQPFTSGSVTVKDAEDLKQQRVANELAYQDAVRNGYDPAPLIENRKNLDAAEKQMRDQKRSSGTLVAAGIIADSVLGPSTPAQAAETPKMAELRRQRENYNTVAQGGVFTEGPIQESGKPSKVVSGTPDLSIASTPTKEILATMKEQGIDPIALEKEKDSVRRTLLQVQLSAAKLQGGAASAQEEIDNLNANKDAPWAQIVLGGLGVVGGTKLTLNTLALKAAELGNLPKNLISAGYGAYGSAGKFATDFPTLYKLHQAGKLAGKVGSNALKIGKSFGVQALVEVGARAAVGAAYGAIDPEDFSTGFNRYFESEWNSLKDDWSSETTKSQNRLDKFEQAIKDREKPRAIAKSRVAELDDLIKKEGGTTATQVPQIKLADAVQKLGEDINAGNIVDVSTNLTNGELSPILRAIEFHTPEIINPDGTIDVTLAAQVLRDTMNVSTDIQNGKIVVSPVEAAPVEVTKIDYASVTNAYRAAEVAEQNAIIQRLKDNGVPVTKDNIDYIKSRTLSDSSGAYYTPEFGPEGVYRGKRTEGPSELERLRAITERQKIAAATAATTGNRFGTITTDPRTGRTTETPEAGNKALALSHPTDTPYLNGGGTTPAKMDEYRKSVEQKTRIIEVARVNLPNALRRYGADNLQNENAFFDSDGNIDSEKLVADEGAKREFIRQMFGLTRDLGQGLGQLSATDYTFIFTQTGIPVTIQEAVAENNGGAIEKAVRYLTKDFVQRKPKYFQNVLDDLVSVSKRGIEESVGFNSGGKVKITYPTNSINFDGSSKPYSTINSELAKGFDRFIQRKATDGSVNHLLHMLSTPKDFVVSKDFANENDAKRYAIRRIAEKLNYSEEHVIQFLTTKRP
jgi:hypothetical protein